ncbi:DUF4407 domain-containing protein [Mucilaginibacter conchicola]|uniref:DUF4407 domain-containing protein n=1 Tax=Mucilaginibacter conchicola TaxID=2303333 RepID=A0A372NM31_9SPHI|nr:DUF4407 domain-containing protein [Mucilaginibacter conchicola]RFZ90009.1 DUF4407 domain-containing protein [Mucilaginibacter conchicola]
MSKNLQKEAKPYSKIQYFFWLWSGVEISILKDCPTDYNRQAGIGFTIFMTTLLAFCSGSYAGWYFGETMASAVIFGCIWSALIFSIDRSMVLTLKKDPAANDQKFWAPFLSRAILAFLIAMIISIPLELLIFNEEIQANLATYKEKQTSHLIDLTAKNTGMSSKQQQYLRDSSEKAKAERLLALPEPLGDQEYINLKRTATQLREEYRQLSESFNRAQSITNTNWARIPFNDGVRDMNSNEAARYQQSKEISLKKRKELYGFNQSLLIKAEKDQSDYLTNWRNTNKKNLEQAESSQIAHKHQIDTALDIQSQRRTTQDSLTKENKGFITRFMVLEDLASLTKSKENPASATMFWLLWLIRLLFIVIEILPTIAKIATPIGAYDVALRTKELDIEKDMMARTTDYLAHQSVLRSTEQEATKRQLEDRIKIEGRLHKNLLTEIAEVQGAVARGKLAEFKKLHLPVNNPPVLPMENVLWKQMGGNEPTEYLFKSGHLGEAQSLIIIKSELVETGAWFFQNNGTEITMQMADEQRVFKFKAVNGHRLELSNINKTIILERV